MGVENFIFIILHNVRFSSGKVVDENAKLKPLTEYAKSKVKVKKF